MTQKSLLYHFSCMINFTYSKFISSTKISFSQWNWRNAIQINFLEKVKPGNLEKQSWRRLYFMIKIVEGPKKRHLIKGYIMRKLSKMRQSGVFFFYLTKGWFSGRGNPAFGNSSVLPMLNSWKINSFCT